MSCVRRSLDNIGGIVVRPFVSRTTFNGLLFRGGMFVLSTAQFIEHLGRTVGQAGRLLDIGAGDGGVTAQAAALFSEVMVTESDWAMRWRLAQRGYKCSSPESFLTEWTRGVISLFDVILCFNVLDRCDRPLTLLRDMKAQLVVSTGQLMLAVVFPFRPFVENGTKV